MAKLRVGSTGVFKILYDSFILPEVILQLIIFFGFLMFISLKLHQHWSIVVTITNKLLLTLQ
jgi:hypothetical protein